MFKAATFFETLRPICMYSTIMNPLYTGPPTFGGFCLGEQLILEQDLAILVQSCLLNI